MYRAMNNLTLTARQRQLLTILDAAGQIIPGRTLAGQLGLSTRTVRQAISELNDTLDPDQLRIVAVSGKGYVLEVLDRRAFHELINDHRHMKSRDDRVHHLILTLIEENDWKPLADLEEEFYVSRTTLENDLKEVRRLIVDSEPYIGLTRRAGSLLFENDEQKRRDILVRVYTERWDYHSREGVAYRDGYLDASVIEDIRKELRRVLSERQISLDDYGHIYLLLSCAVLYERNLRGCPLKAVRGDARTPETEAAAQLLLSRLRKKWEIETTGGDALWLAEAVARLRVLGFMTGDGSLSEETVKRPLPENSSGESLSEKGSEGSLTKKADTELSPDTALVKQCISRLRAACLPDLEEDPAFLRELAQQIRAFRNHHISFQESSRYELEALARNYEFLRKPAISLKDFLENATGYRLRDGEELYLLPLLCSAVERRERALRHRLRTVVVSHLNSMMTEYLCENLRKLFGTRIDIAAALPVYDRQAIEALDPVLIITTVRQQEFRISGVPTVVTGATVSEEDLLRIDACIQTLERQLR